MTSARVLAVAVIALLGPGVARTAALDRPPAGDMNLRSPEVTRALDAIRPRAIEAHVRFLAHDSLEGRATATRGYDVASRYVAAQFESLGLAPGGEGGSWFQSVPLRSGSVDLASRSIRLRYNDRTRTLVPDVGYVMGGDVVSDSAAVEAPVVFAGYGVSAPELGYDDLAGIDVKGRIVAVLSGAPPTFPHDQRAHYSNSIVKNPNLAARGAVGVLSIRTPVDERRSPWERSVRQSRLPSMRWVDERGRAADTWPDLRVSATLSRKGAEVLFLGAPRTLDQVFAAGDSGRPQAFPLPSTARLHRRTRRADTSSPNVVGLLRGSDPRIGDEVVVLSAHLDHLGISTPVEGDSINNGAFDNASGIGAMIEIARAFASGPRPRRSILFIAVTGEEKGLVGSHYFATHPTVPIDKIVANLNLDMIVAIAPIEDLVGYGAEHSTLGPLAGNAARRLGLTLTPDPIPDEVVFVRSDQYSFVRQGIPSLFLVRGQRGEGTAARIDAWRKTIYHSPQDDLSQPIDWNALATFARAGWLIGHQLAAQDERPRWNPGDFFGATFRAGARRSP